MAAMMKIMNNVGWKEIRRSIHDEANVHYGKDQFEVYKNMDSGDYF